MPPEKMLGIERVAVPLGIVVSMVLTSVGVATYLGERMMSIEHRMDLIGRDLAQAAQHAEASLTRSEFRAWVQTQQAAGNKLTDLPPR